MVTTAHPWEVSCGALLIPQEINLAGINIILYQIHKNL